MDDARQPKAEVSGSKSDEDLPDSTTNVSGERTRRQTNGRGSGNRRARGKLDGIMSTPEDIFCKIAAHLGPYDLFHLVRTCKATRDLIMSKSSTWVWRAAEEACGLPECPSDLNHPQYATFVFGSFCSLCLKKSTLKHIALFRVRLCRKCYSAKIVSGWRLPSRDVIKHLTLEEKSDIYSLVPAKCTSDRRSDVSSNSEEKQNSDSIFYSPAFEEAFTVYSALPSDSDKKTFAKQRREIICDIKTESVALEAWFVEKEISQARAISAMKDHRQEDIYARLKELGYSDDDFKSDHDEKKWKWRRLIVQPRKLTERVWNNIRPQLEETIRLRWEKAQPALDLIEKRHDELANLVMEFVSSGAGKNCFIVAKEAMQLPLALQTINDIDRRVSFSQAIRDSLKTQILELGEIWLSKLEENCARMISDGPRNSGPQTIETISSESSESSESEQCDDMAVCQLATSFFATRPSPSHYGLQLRTFDEIVKGIRDEYDGMLSENRTAFEWTFGSRVYPAPSSLINALYKSVNVTATSHDEMAARGMSFVCLRCASNIRRPMTWAELVRHFYEEGQYSTSEEAQSLALATTSISDHDENKAGRLAAYQAEPSHTEAICDVDRSGWIKLCRCEVNSIDGHSLRGCEECYSRRPALSYWSATPSRAEYPNQS